MNNDNENKKRINEKLDFFLSEKVKIHIEKSDRTFLNGYLIKKIREGVYLLKEDKFGERYIFVSEIYDVDEFMKEVGK